MLGSDRWRGRAATLEAVGWLLLARWLIARVPLARWRGHLGHLLSAQSLPPLPGSGDSWPENLAARRLSRAVERAALRLPGESRCLARAVALQAMLRMRRIDSVMIIGVRPRAERGGIDDLHAWVWRRGETLVGASESTYLPLVGFSTKP